MIIKNHFCIPLFALCMILLSCTDTADDLYSAQKSADVVPVAIDKTYSGPVAPVSRSISSVSDDLEEIISAGYTSVENGSNMKLLFGAQLANLTGLQEGSVYITRYETYHKKIELNGAVYLEDVKYEECGLRRRQSIDGGYVSYTDRGYNVTVIGTNQIDMETHLIHVISDMSGNRLDIYYPCRPSEIKWRYYFFR